ncbi:hypothetical protein [Comamonas aquatica]|uniref:hypothetical protein n=1 Tax=Comamonas aquatica TaxID=225991 RepID=UPI001EF2F59D|nr:hypothetical protein [Comamonas aquatica]
MAIVLNLADRRDSPRLYGAPTSLIRPPHCDAKHLFRDPIGAKKAHRAVGWVDASISVTGRGSLPLYCKQDIFIFYIQWLIFLLIGNTMKNTMLRKGLTIF